MSAFRGRSVHLFLISLVALSAVVVGWFMGLSIPMLPEGNKASFLELFWNNIRVGGLVTLGGLLTMGAGSLLLVGFNMMILGVASGSVYATSGVGPILTGVLPHAPCELAAVILCALVGFEGWRILGVLREKLVSEVGCKFDFKGPAWMLIVALLLYLAGAFAEYAISYV